jgi:hypothetical protein
MQNRVNGSSCRTGVTYEIKCDNVRETLRSAYVRGCEHIEVAREKKKQSALYNIVKCVRLARCYTTLNGGGEVGPNMKFYIKCARMQVCIIM